MVLSHEFGHFIVAKKSGIRVDEFAFGFRPRLWSVKKGETEYSLNALPIGGYVKIFGEDPDDESINGENKERSFVHKPWHIKAAVMLAGVTMNFLVAWLLLSVGFMTGLPSSVNSASDTSLIANAELTVTGINKDSPAEMAGLRVGDRLLHVDVKKDQTDLPSITSLQYFVRKHPNDSINISLRRANTIQNIVITPKLDPNTKEPVLGVGIDMIGTLKLPIHKALWQGLKLSGNLFWGTAVGFYTLIHDSILGHANISSLTGPVGIVGVVGDATKLGFVYLLSFTALISINLAVINLIPFPALDGGRLLFLIIEKIKGSRIKPVIANWVNTIGFGILMLLMLVVTYHDIVKLF